MKLKVQIETFPELRKAKGITKGLIEKSGVRYQTYLNMVQGNNRPMKKTILRICELFNITEKEFDKLLGNTVWKKQ